MKKRFISMLLAFIICISFVVPVSAASPTITGNIENYYKLDFNIPNFPDLSLLLSQVSPNDRLISVSYDTSGSSSLFAISSSRDFRVEFTSTYMRVSTSGNNIKKYNAYKGQIINPSYDYSNYYYYNQSGTTTQYLYDFLGLISTVPDFDDTNNDYYALGIDAIGFSEWLHEHPEFFDTLKKNFPNFHWDDDIATTKFLMQWWNAYGGRTDAMIENFQELVELGLVDVDSIPLPPSPDYMWSLSSQIQKQYNKYNESQQIKPVPNPQQPIVIDTPDFVSPSDSDSSDVVYLKEIIRLLSMEINYNDSRQYETNVNLGDINNTVNGFVPVINEVNTNIGDLNTNFNALLNFTNDINAELGGINTTLNTMVDGINLIGGLAGGMAGLVGGIAGGIADITAELGDLNLKLGDLAIQIGDFISNGGSGGNGSCNYDESFWERMLIPTFSDFDEMQALFLSKFPIMNDIATISIDGDSTTITNNLPDKELDSMLETGIVPLSYQAEFPIDSQNPYSFEYSESDITTKDLFSFTMPTGTNTWMDAFNGMSVSIINFKKFNTAILFFKGIISVLAIFAFSKWLLQFVPKIATGASTGD